MAFWISSGPLFAFVKPALITRGSAPVGSALQVLDGGAKFVVQSGDALKVISDTASSLDVWVSAVDAISS